MNLITPPVVPGNQLVSDVRPDKNFESAQLPEEDHQLDDLPQGALTLMTQIQPMHQRALALAVGNNRGTVVIPGKLPGEGGESPRQLVAPRQMIAHSELSIRQSMVTKSEFVVTGLGPSSLSVLSLIPDPALAATILTSTVIAEPGSSLNTLKQVAERDKNDVQPLLIPGQVSVEKNQPLPMPVQTSAAMLRSGGDNAPLIPVPLPNESTGYLKVPFSKGEAIGQVIINKPNADAPQQLLLSTNNADVSSLLRDSVQLLDEPRWRLADHQEDKHGHGQGQRSSSEEPDENAGDGNRRELMRQEAEV